MERQHLVGQHLVGQHLVGQHLVGEHLVGQHLVWTVGVNGGPTTGCTSRARTVRAAAMAAAMAATTGGIWVATLGGLETGRAAISIPWWVVAAMLVVAEAYAVHVHVAGDAHSFSLSEVPLVIGLFALEPGELLAAVLLAGVVSLALVRRQSLLKLAFNLSQFALVSSMALLTFHRLLPDGDPVSPSAWSATLLAVLPAAMLAAVLTEAVIALCQGRSKPRRLPGVLGLVAIGVAANVSLGLVAVTLHVTEPAALWMLAVPGAAVYLAARAYLSERAQRARVEFLYGAGRLLARSSDVERILPAVLEHACETFRADRAELILFPRRPGDTGLRVAWHADGDVDPVAPLVPDPAMMIAASVAADDGGLLLAAGGEHRPVLAGQGYRDAVVVAVQGESGPIGSVVLANRLGDVSTFTRDEVRLLETFAGQLGVALENGELERSLAALRDREGDLRDRALHDPLTGLANRDLFGERLETALARTSGPPLAVLFVDLDGFKAVNDTHGHAAGDDALGQVADRIRSCLRPADTAARLGGDEFAVLVERVGTPAAVAVAMRILEALQEPLGAGDGAVSVGASIGVALGVPGRTTAGELLRQADGAMYAAKRAGKGAIEVAPSSTADAGRETVSPS